VPVIVAVLVVVDDGEVRVAVYVPSPLFVTAPRFPPVVFSATSAPPDVRLLPSASRSWTVIVDVLVPLAGIEVGDAVIWEVAGEAGPGVMEKAVLVAPVRPVALAASVYPFPVRLMERLPKVATPLTAATVVVPESVPLPGFEEIAIVTFPVKDVMVVPPLSTARTVMAGEIDAPACSVVGCWTNSRRVATAVNVTTAVSVIAEPFTVPLTVPLPLVEGEVSVAV
jgi:hypothetical protein